MFNFLEKIFFKRILKKMTKLIPYGQELWEKNQDEMVEKAKEAIKKALSNVIKRALEKQSIKIFDDTDK